MAVRDDVVGHRRERLGEPLLRLLGELRLIATAYRVGSAALSAGKMMQTSTSAPSVRASRAPSAIASAPPGVAR